MKIAGIDIGTNTILLLVGDVDNEGNISTIEHHQRLPRLGKNVDASGMIQRTAFDTIASIIKEYVEIAVRQSVKNIVACATSAVRDAANQKEFLSYIKTTAGINVEILSGEEEARWTYRGAVQGIRSLTGPAVVLDIGGGSTELSFPHPDAHNGHSPLHQYSLQIGAVRITERFFKHDPPLAAELQSATTYILEELAQVRNPGFHQYQLVGVAGTVTSLACLDQQLNAFDVKKVSGYSMTKDRVTGWMVRLRTMDNASIRSLSDVLEGRADIITAGMLILCEVMELFRFPSIIVSERGLRYGLLLREWERRT